MHVLVASLVSIVTLLLPIQNAGAVESQVYRQDKHMHLSAEYGVAVAPIQTAGFGFGVQAKDNSHIEFGYAQGEKDVDYAVMTAKLYSLKFKQFWSNTFYTNTGFGYRDVTDRTTDKVSERFEVKRHGRSAGLDVSLGNRWQWDNITVGCDWVGFFHPLTQARKETFAFKGNPGFGANGSDQSQHGGGSHGSGDHSRGSSASYDRHEGDWDRLSKHGTWQFMRASLGVNF